MSYTSNTLVARDCLSLVDHQGQKNTHPSQKANVLTNYFSLSLAQFIHKMQNKVVYMYSNLKHVNTLNKISQQLM